MSIIVAGELEVVASGRAGLADLLEDRVLAGRVGGRQVGQRRQGGVALGAQRRLLVAQLSARGRRARRAALAAPRVGAPLSARLAWFCSARSASSSVVIARQRSSSSSTRSIAAAASAPRRASAVRDGVRFATDQPDVENARLRYVWAVFFFFALAGFLAGAAAAAVVLDDVVVVAAVDALTGGGRVPIGLTMQGTVPGSFGAARPAYVDTNSATVARVLTDDDVLRHVGAGEASVLDRVQDARDRTLAADV